jgi:hypothetical protein
VLVEAVLLEPVDPPRESVGHPGDWVPARWDAVDDFRLVDRKIAEEWAADDAVAILQGVGA